MGWKNIKEHYKIEHIVQVVDEKILIGSSYIPDLISISKEGEVSWGRLGESDNKDLQRYYQEMTSDLPKLKELLNSFDFFYKSLPVFTYKNEKIIEKKCEEYGWPNATHDGQLMYDGKFFKTREEAITAAKEDLRAEVKYLMEEILDVKNHLKGLEKKYEEAKQNLQILELPDWKPDY